MPDTFLMPVVIFKKKDFFLFFSPPTISQSKWYYYFRSIHKLYSIYWFPSWKMGAQLNNTSLLNFSSLPTFYRNILFLILLFGPIHLEMLWIFFLPIILVGTWTSFRTMTIHVTGSSPYSVSPTFISHYRDSFFIL